MVPADYFSSDNLWQVQKAFSVQHPFYVFPAVFQALCPNLPRLLVFCLQLK